MMLFAPVFSWLAGKLGSLWAKVIEIAFIALLVIAPFYIAYHSGKSNCEQANALQQLQARVDTVTFLSKITAAGEGAVGDYILRRGAAAVFYQTIYQEVPRATSLWKPSPSAPAQALPACIFTRGFVGVWNSAFEAGHDVERLSAAAGRVAGGSAGDRAVDDADLLDAGIARADLLTNHIANADADDACRDRFAAVKDWDQRTFGARK